MQPHSNRSLASLVIAGMVVLVTIAGPGAQSTVGLIRGVVTDSTGDVVPGVDVTLHQRGTRDRRTLTNEKGEFAFLGIDPGRYEVMCELSGFRTQRMTVELTAGATVNLAMSF